MTGSPLTDGGFERDGSTSRPELTYEIDDDEPPSEAVVRAVAALTDTPPLDLEPLYDVVDPARLDGAVASADADGVRVEFSLTFDGCAVTVTGEEVRVRTLDSES